MKKFLSMLLVLITVFTLAACKPGMPSADATQSSANATDSPDSGSVSVPAEDPTGGYTEAPTEKPVETPTEAPTEKPTEAPTEKPTEAPTEAPTEKPTEAPTEKPADPPIDVNGSYTTKEDVALYIHTYGHLPHNFVTKSEYKKLHGQIGDKCVGGDRFQNREGLLPKAPGRTYTECDIDTMHNTNRGAKRIVFSNDGLVFYTGDHYRSFTLLYGEV